MDNIQSEQDKQREKLRRMTEQPVEVLVCQMAVPSIVSMMVSAVYNMADTFFIGKINTAATGAAGVVFSYMALVQAIGFFFGQGSGNYISRALGGKNTDGAEKMASTGFFSALIVSLLLAVGCGFSKEPLLRFFGATPTMMDEAVGYFRYILIATPFIMMSFVLNNQLRYQGNALRGMFGIAAGAVLNVALDPILMFACGMGVRGASLATAISQAVSFIVLFVMTMHSDGVKIKLSAFRPRLGDFGEITAGGLPSLARQGLACVATVCLNRAAGAYGDSAIAAFTIVNRACMICTSALLGFGQGFQPVCGFNYGAGLYDRVKKAYWFCIKVGTVAMTLLGAGIFIFAKQVVGAFRAEDAMLIEIGSKALRYDSIMFPLMSMIIISNMYLQNTRKTVRATITAIARQGFIFIPVLILMTSLWGLNGLQLSQAAADFLTFCLTIPLTLTALHGMGRQR